MALFVLYHGTVLGELDLVEDGRQTIFQVVMHYLRDMVSDARENMVATDGLGDHHLDLLGAQSVHLVEFSPQHIVDGSLKEPYENRDGNQITLVWSLKGILDPFKLNSILIAPQ